MAFDEKVGQLWVEISAKKGNVADAFKSVRDDYDATTKKAQAYTAFMATGQGQEAAKALVQSQAAASWAKLVAEQGKSGAMLTVIGGKLKGLKAGLQELGNMPLIGFGAATASVAGLAASASPIIWSTLTSSFTLLSATIGQMFLPYIIEAARWIQTAARWFRELDPQVKTNAAGWVIAGVAATGFIVVLSKMLGLVMMLGSAFKMLGLASVLINPAGAALGGVAIGAGAALAVGSLASRYGTASTPRTLQTLPPIGDMQRSPDLFHAFLSRIFTVNPLTNIQSGYNNFMSPSSPYAPGPGSTSNLSMVPANHPSRNLPLHLPGGFINQNRVNADDLMMNGPRRPSGGPDRLMMSAPFQSQSFGIEEAGKRMQQRAASMGELDAAIETQRLNATMQALEENTRAGGPIGGVLTRLLERLQQMTGIALGG